MIDVLNELISDVHLVKILHFEAPIAALFELTGEGVNGRTVVGVLRDRDIHLQGFLRKSRKRINGNRRHSRQVSHESRWAHGCLQRYRNGVEAEFYAS